MVSLKDPEIYLMKKSLTIDSVNPWIRHMGCGLAGPLEERASTLKEELRKGAVKPFKEVINANVGDIQALGQKPILFLRQVLAAISCPQLLDSDNIFPYDVVHRAKQILSSCNGYSTGSYANAAGITTVRKKIAEFIERRDGHPSNINDIFLTPGTTAAIPTVMKLFLNGTSGKKCGILVPIPIYPLYSAILNHLNIERVNYHIIEETGWSIEVSELERAIIQAKSHCQPKAISVINPGNPIGYVLKEENIKEIISFAYRHNLLILADEVYQNNIHSSSTKFKSFKQVLMEMNDPRIRKNVQLASFMSVSKGYMNECGLRGGYVEFTNTDTDVKALYLKSIESIVVPPVLGMVGLDCLVDPPKEWEPSYQQFYKDRTKITTDLTRNAILMQEAFNGMEGVTCAAVEGSVFLYPRINMPMKAILEAEKLDLNPSEFYASQLLEGAGILCVPGSRFEQPPTACHIRLTILPQIDKLKSMISSFKRFHTEFMQQYSCERERKIKMNIKLKNEMRIKEEMRIKN